MTIISRFPWSCADVLKIIFTVTVFYGSTAYADVNESNGKYNPFNVTIQPSKETTLEFEHPRTTHSSVANENVPLVETKCESTAKVKFSHAGNGCTPMKMRESMAEHVNKFFLVCTQEAAKAADLGPVTSVEVKSSGCYNDRTTHSGKVSNHARGRACDISQFKLHPAGHVMPGTVPGAESGNKKKFYDAFRDCWQKTIFVSSNWGCQGKTGESGSGSIGAPGHEPPPAKHDHCDHIHLSFPECADKGDKS